MSVVCVSLKVSHNKLQKNRYCIRCVCDTPWLHHNSQNSFSTGSQVHWTFFSYDWSTHAKYEFNVHVGQKLWRMLKSTTDKQTHVPVGHKQFDHAIQNSNWNVTVNPVGFSNWVSKNIVVMICPSMPGCCALKVYFWARETWHSYWYFRTL